VVPFEHAEIRKKIHYTYRLLYLKDVVLARILDDPTFSVLNSLIFFHQVDIVNHIQSNQAFLKALFAIFTDDSAELERKKNAVLFIQNCCAVSKNIQPPSRAALYQNFINHGLFTVITFALRHRDAAVRVAGTDILVALIDHDAHLVRAHIARAINEKAVPLTDTLIELLLVEVDLGVKSQMADAIKILLDPASANVSIQVSTHDARSKLMAKQRAGMVADQGHHGPRIPTQTNLFIQNFYEEGAKRLFKPLKDLEGRKSMSGLSVQETSLYTHLVEVLCFFVRQHAYQSKIFILAENLHARVAQLLLCPQKYMKLIALKWFRTCIGLQDDFHNGQITKNFLFEPILNIVYETMPRDNLLNSACLELFEYINRESIKQLVYHLAENYRERLTGITYVNTFHGLLHKYEQFQHPFLGSNGEGDTSFTTEPDTPDALRSRMMNGRQIFSGLREPDPDEDAYFNTDDDADTDLGDEEESTLPTTATARLPNGHASPLKPLVDYPDDDDEDSMDDILASSPDPVAREKKPIHPADPADSQRGRNRTPVAVDGSPGAQQSPPESVATKRRREEGDDDELDKMMGGNNKRRNSSASLRSVASENKIPALASSPQVEGSPMSVSYPDNDENEAPLSPKSQPVSSPVDNQQQHTPTHALRRKGSLKVKNEGVANPGRFAIKPINLSGGRSPTDSPQAKDAQTNGNGNGNGSSEADGEHAQEGGGG
jgi:protein phosphatase-4 regulatory subunit 3